MTLYVISKITAALRRLFNDKNMRDFGEPTDQSPAWDML